MQIAADVSEISKISQVDLIFILNALSKSDVNKIFVIIHFA